MNIQRIRRTRQDIEDEICDFCDDPIKTGFTFSGEGVGGPRSNTFLNVCDKCLAITKSSDNGFLPQERTRP